MAASRRARLKGLATRATTSAAARLGLDVVPRGAYSPLARVPAAGDPSWERRLDLPGVRLGLDAQAAFITDALSEHVAAFAVPAPFRLDNPFYGPGDAELLFALLRHEPPLRILELGSGWSTHVARAAAPHADLVAVDPQPQLALPPGRATSPSTPCSSRSTASPPSRPATSSSSTPPMWSSAGARSRASSSACSRACGRACARVAGGRGPGQPGQRARRALHHRRPRLPRLQGAGLRHQPRLRARARARASVRPGTAPAPSRRPTGGAGRSGRG